MVQTNVGGLSFPILFCQAIKAQYPLLLVLYSRLPGDAGHGEQLVGGAGKAEVRQTRRLVRVTCEASGTRGASSTLVFTASSWLLSLFIIRFSLARQLSVQMGVDTGRP